MGKKATFLLVAATALLLSLTIPATAQQQRDYATKAAPSKLMRGAKGHILNQQSPIGTAIQQPVDGQQSKAAKARRTKQ